LNVSLYLGPELLSGIDNTLGNSEYGWDIQHRDMDTQRFLHINVSHHPLCVLSYVTTDDRDANPRPSRSVMLSLRVPHVLFSNLKVDQLKVMTEMYKPYKGVRVTSVETIEWRW
jgi:hypothetical protein